MTTTPDEPAKRPTAEQITDLAAAVAAAADELDAADTAKADALARHRRARTAYEAAQRALTQALTR